MFNESSRRVVDMSTNETTPTAETEETDAESENDNVAMNAYEHRKRDTRGASAQEIANASELVTGTLAYSALVESIINLSDRSCKKSHTQKTLLQI